MSATAESETHPSVGSDLPEELVRMILDDLVRETAAAARDEWKAGHLPYNPEPCTNHYVLYPRRPTILDAIKTTAAPPVWRRTARLVTPLLWTSLYIAAWLDQWQDPQSAQAAAPSIIREDDASTDEEGDLYPSFEDEFDTELDYAFRQSRGKPLDIFIDARGWGRVSATAVLNLIAEQFHRVRTLSIIGVESLPFDLVRVEHVPSLLELELRWCSTGSGIYDQRSIEPDLMQLASWLGPAIAKATSLSLLGGSDAHILPGGRLFDSSAEWASALSANHITCLDIHDYRARLADWVTESIAFRTPTLLSLHSPVTTWNRCLSWLDGSHHSYYYGMDPFLLYEACAWSRRRAPFSSGPRTPTKNHHSSTH
ncbi:hypothetical protein K523DRAFT_421290 [Schizophyllum commune Tattone D]|nr:hypothetical protein K523DRAFT_421290 [Schizophyllum commune Tattone D]